MSLAPYAGLLLALGIGGVLSFFGIFGAKVAQGKENSPGFRGEKRFKKCGRAYFFARCSIEVGLGRSIEIMQAWGWQLDT